MDPLFIGVVCLAFLLGLLVATAWTQARSLQQKARDVVVYDHDGHPVSVPRTDATHWLLKGFVEEWVAPPTEAE